jgi:hypothetical protein
MRLAPVPLFYYRNPELAVYLAGESARLTHGDQKAIDACRYFAALIVAAVRGEPKDALLNEKFYENHSQWFGRDKLNEDVLRIARGSYKKKGGYEEGIRGKNYIVNTLEAALWAFWSDGNSFAEGALNAVNLGDDTDTTAAVYGQLAGACYGFSAIPREWTNRLYARDFVICVAEWLYVEGGSNRSNTSRQQQQDTSQHQTQTRIPPSQFTSHQGIHSSTQANPSVANKGRTGYDPPPQQPPTQRLLQTLPTSNYDAASTSLRKTGKLDPAALPVAGVPSGHNQNSKKK